MGRGEDDDVRKRESFAPLLALQLIIL